MGACSESAETPHHAACAGGLYFIDLCLGFHVGFLGQHNMAKKLVMDRRAIAWYYTRRGNFPVDLITAIAFFSQARATRGSPLPPSECSASNHSLSCVHAACPSRPAPSR